MKIISLLSQKGGVGKSTISVNIATYFKKYLNINCILIDTDPQTSSSSWYDLRDDEYPVVISCQASRLDTVLATAQKENVEIVFIDTPGKTESSSLKAAKLSDYCIVPVKPAFFDLKAAEETLDICRLANKKAYVLLNEMQPNQSNKNETLKVIQSLNVDYFENTIGDRIAFKHAIANGMSVNEYDCNSKAAKEIKRLCDEIKEKLI
jgi:chromosome partitioning protein